MTAILAAFAALAIAIWALASRIGTQVDRLGDEEAGFDGCAL